MSLCWRASAVQNHIIVCVCACPLIIITTLHACQWRAWLPPTPNLFAVPHLSSCDSLSASRLTDSWYEMESRCCRILVRLCGICHISTSSSSLACTFFCFFSLYYTPARSFEFVSFFLFFYFSLASQVCRSIAALLIRVLSGHDFRLFVVMVKK